MKLLVMTLVLLLVGCATTEQIPVNHEEEMKQVIHTVQVCMERIERSPAHRKERVRCDMEIQSYLYWKKQYIYNTGLSEEEVERRVDEAITEWYANRQAR